MKPRQILESYLFLTTRSSKHSGRGIASGTAMASLVAVFSIGSMSLLDAAVSWTNPITGTNPNPANPCTAGQMCDANLPVSGIGREAGITGTDANNRDNANSWLTAALDSTAY